MRVVMTGDGSKTLYSEAYRQTFHSSKGALAESRHVFLEGSGVAARLTRGERTRVLEVGFGTGLNFLVTADSALEMGAELHYCALERSLLAADALASLGYREHLRHRHLFDCFIDRYGRLGEGKPLEVTPTIRLELLLGEATEQPLPRGCFDAVYLDAFSPDANPELWSEAFLKGLCDALAPHGLLSTYSVKGEVRRCLVALGFSAWKRPGPPGGKREMMVAAKRAQDVDPGGWGTLGL
jgi:tRNA U34 5-methylaminomethyl-2-thiouridine-forming methyltransferase MnmC